MRTTRHINPLHHAPADLSRRSAGAAKSLALALAVLAGQSLKPEKARGADAEARRPFPDGQRDVVKAEKPIPMADTVAVHLDNAINALEGKPTPDAADGSIEGDEALLAPLTAEIIEDYKVLVSISHSFTCEKDDEEDKRNARRDFQVAYQRLVAMFNQLTS